LLGAWYSVCTEIRTKAKESCVLPVDGVEDADTPVVRGESVGRVSPTPNISLKNTKRVTGCKV
jgi:hypothetical protein